jgi:hypothetical protein
VGGNLRSAAGSGRSLVPRETIARFDVASGNLLAWQIRPGTLSEDEHARDMAVTCDRLFVAYGGGLGKNWTRAIDLTDDTGDILWQKHANGDVQSVALWQDRLFFGGHFTEFHTGLPFTRFVVLITDGTIDPTWKPSFDGAFFGPWDILAVGNQVWVGGNFKDVSGVQQWGIARFTDAPSSP